jgi:hypothetical protein
MPGSACQDIRVKTLGNRDEADPIFVPQLNRVEVDRVPGGGQVNDGDLGGAD